jgi:predicted house-cleaning noncanonical NTP pyrophosphatase (MazG superfamily)
MPDKPKNSSHPTSSVTSLKWKKLVRDNVVPLCLKQGCKVAYVQLKGEDLLEALARKLIEEAAEIAGALDLRHSPQGHQELINELADLQTVLNALREAVGITPQDIKTAAAKKIWQKGGFAEGYYVEEIDIPNTHPMLAYFQAQTKKYPLSDGSS